MRGDGDQGWSDSSARAVLQLMVHSVAEMIGFEVAALSVVLGDQLVTVAYTGPEEFRAYLEEPDPVGVLDPVLEQAEASGRLRFLAAEDYDVEALEGHWVDFGVAGGQGPDAWRPNDVMLAVLTDDDGRLVGVLSVDRPVSGMRPDDVQRGLLERYAEQAERAVLTTFEREELVRRVAMAESARRLVRAAAMPDQASLEAVLHHTHRPLVEGFGASGTWIRLLEPEGDDHGSARTHDGAVVELQQSTVELAHTIAPRLWAEQRVLVLGDDEEGDASEGLASLAAAARHQLSELGLSRALGVPLGVGSECLGFLVLTRRAADPAWSTGEVDSALQIGHDLGAALMTARGLARERALVAELQQLDDYRSQLIATLSHELRTPLTVISGNLELLDDLDLGEPATRYREAMTRGTTRMRKVVDDLLLLARVSHPQHPLVRVPVDLRRVAGDIVGLIGSAATAKELSVVVDLPPGDLVVPGDPGELDRLVGNLVSNAVKYTAPGGTVTVGAVRRGTTVLLHVADDGLGISEEDQVGLFHPFFRTSNPAALREPGTGLGLAIVATIVERHQGSVEVRSRPGDGTTFTITLPAA